MRPINLRMVVWLGMINNPNGTVGWGLSRNEWAYSASYIYSYQRAGDVIVRRQITIEEK